MQCVLCGWFSDCTILIDTAKSNEKIVNWKNGATLVPKSALEVDLVQNDRDEMNWEVGKICKKKD